MEFKRDDCTFTVPDRPTVRQQLAWFSAAGGYDKNDERIRLWEGARQLIQTWACEVLPDYQIGLDEITNPSQTSVVLWVGMTVLKFMNDLEDIPKNE